MNLIAEGCSREGAFNPARGGHPSVDVDTAARTRTRGQDARSHTALQISGSE